jgi:hypothetical protein
MWDIADRIEAILKDVFKEKWDRQAAGMAEYIEVYYDALGLGTITDSTVRNYLKRKSHPPGIFLDGLIRFIEHAGGKRVDGHWLLTGDGEMFITETPDDIVWKTKDGHYKIQRTRGRLIVEERPPPDDEGE